jgi:hypothetical protein
MNGYFERSAEEYAKQEATMKQKQSDLLLESLGLCREKERPAR